MKAICLCFATLSGLASLLWGTAKANAYESADYTVTVSDSPFEIREYPDMMLAATKMKLEAKRDNGSFMRLFRYIGGANDNRQKVAMTTPVFVEFEPGSSDGQMGFMLPKTVAAARVPEPSDREVEISKRVGGSYAVIRFNGRMNSESVSKAGESLRAWMKTKGYVGVDRMESASYDPPWIPARKRRNEVLIRLKSAGEKNTQRSDDPQDSTITNSQ